MTNQVKGRKISRQESDMIAYLQLLSCIAIISCHIVHAYGNIWASVLNTGVQIFFIISGYLYGAKRVSGIKSFYLGRIVKVYLPYLIWTFIAAGLILVFANEYFFIRKFIFQIGLIETLDGQRHLWFIRVLALCYFVLPFIDMPKGMWSSIVCLLLFGGILILMYQLTGEVNFIWVVTYYIGYILGRWPRIIRGIAIPIILSSIIVLSNVSPEDYKFSNYASLLHVYSALVVVILFWGVTHVWCNHLSSRMMPPPPIFKRIGRPKHLSSNLIGRKLDLIFNKLFKVAKSTNKYIKTHLMGRYEFEAYLTHQTVILGPLTVIGLTGNRVLDIFICLSLIVLLTTILKKVSIFLTCKISSIKSLPTVIA